MNQFRRKVHINNLPREIIENIFHFHVIDHRKERYPLLLTSRKWNIIACSYSGLWRSIALCCKTELPPETVLCPDLDSLALVINRTGRATFDLYLGGSFTTLGIKDLQPFVGSVGSNWLSRCRALTIFPQEGKGSNHNLLGPMLFSGGLDSLETLEIRHSYLVNCKKWEMPLRAIMERIDSSAFSLKNLRVRITGLAKDDGTRWITQNIYRFPNILHRLTKVMLRNTCEAIPWEHFINLEEIDVWCSAELFPLVTLDVPVVNHLVLSIDKPNEMVSSTIWQQLTHLTFKDTIDEYGPFVLNLPSLISLQIIICAFDLRHIQAPKLEELTLRLDTECEIDNSCRDLDAETPFTPRIIHIDVQVTDFSTEGLDVFATKLPLWSKVEELNLRVIEGHYLEDVMVNALSGIFPEQCYPKLHSLTVLFPVRKPGIWEGGEEADELFAEQKDEETDQMTSIASRRPLLEGMLEGENPMKRLELGWYVEWGDDYVELDWRIVEWRDCLLV